MKTKELKIGQLYEWTIPKGWEPEDNCFLLNGETNSMKAVRAGEVLMFIEKEESVLWYRFLDKDGVRVVLTRFDCEWLGEAQ